MNIYRNTPILFFIFFTSLTHSQIKLSNDTLHWRSETSLTWTDFKGEADAMADAGGEIACAVLADFKKKNPLKKTKPNVTAVLDRENSWIVTSSKDEAELLYYRVIFNIYEWYARKLRQEFSTTKFGVDPNKVFQEKYNANEAALNDEVNDFRRESELGADQKVVKEWDAKVKKEIKALEAFRD